MSDQGSEHAHIARTGDLHQMRAEVSDQRFQFSVMTPEKEIVSVSLIERKFQRTSLQFYFSD
jgi:hypothetical protein